jgi:hypothetical protein
MKSFVRRLPRIRHAVYATVLQGVIMAAAGLYFDLKNIPNRQDNPLLDPPVLMGLGVTVAVLATVLVVASYLVAPVLEGEIVVLQQPQLPDVQTHMRPHHELPQAA